jgi:hypothetical protein
MRYGVTYTKASDNSSGSSDYREVNGSSAENAAIKCWNARPHSRVYPMKWDELLKRLYVGQLREFYFQVELLQPLQEEPVQYEVRYVNPKDNKNHNKIVDLSGLPCKPKSLESAARAAQTILFPNLEASAWDWENGRLYWTNGRSWFFEVFTVVPPHEECKSISGLIWPEPTKEKEEMEKLYEVVVAIEKEDEDGNKFMETLVDTKMWAEDKESAERVAIVSASKEGGNPKDFKVMSRPFC